MLARFTAAQSRRGRKAVRSPLPRLQPALGSPLFLIHLYLFLSPQTLLFSSTGMHWPEEATPLRRGEEHDASLLNKTSQLLNPPPAPAPCRLTPWPQRPGKLTACQGCRRDQTNSAHTRARGRVGGGAQMCPHFLGGGSSAFCLVSVCIDLIGLIISAGMGQAQLCAPPAPRDAAAPLTRTPLCPSGQCQTPTLLELSPVMEGASLSSIP